MASLTRANSEGTPREAIPATAPAPVATQHYIGLSVDHRVALLNKEAKNLMSTGNYLSAVQISSEAIALNNSPLAVISRAYCYKHLKMWNEAIIDFTTALLQDPTNPASLYAQRGVCNGKIEMYDNAIDDLNKAIQVGTLRLYPMLQ
jgi:tetratricopeptide (TPR) repeat protein